MIENYDKLLDVLEEIITDYNEEESDDDPDVDEGAMAKILSKHEEELGMKVTDLMYSMIQQMRKEMKI